VRCPHPCVFALSVGAVVGTQQLTADAQSDAAAQLRNAQASIQSAARALTVTSANDLYTPEVEREQTAALKAALNRYVVAFSAQKRGTPASAELAAALRHVYDPWAAWDNRSNTPFVTSAILGNRRFLVVSWLLFRGGIGIPRTKGFIQAFSASDGVVQPIASTGDEFDGDGLFVREMPSPVPNQIWLLAYGQRFGDTGSRSDVAVYTFDGARFTTTWSRRDLEGLQVEFDGTLRLKYSRKKGPADRATGGFAFDHFSDEYRITARGPEMIRER
jgi:hypothetical protein